MKRYRVVQRKYAKYNLLERHAGEYLSEDYKDYQYKWVAKFVAHIYSGDSPAGLITMKTEIVEVEA